MQPPNTTPFIDMPTIYSGDNHEPFLFPAS